ncbi:alpha/beta-hydrolase [Aspergillus sclerotiicarbonarius CBS 121057]|uniref:Alpha/beta-hydrolase n=1 Tax=Aspergillus sclerotiicarbonarius (strain CBS 121057 / IBT 28362) TaxID=1448318 RepID=A0A319F063_ASPSB|nr:alpha/beta-hydrolase [Aspergillus sclerotiicarbonarius CBS 121057]
MSSPASSSLWQSGNHAGLVSLGSHSLYLAAAGPQRPITNGRLQPAVIIEAGLCSGIAEWVAVSRLIAQRARVYSYDRAGYGRSEPSPTPEYTAENREGELAQLLEVAGIEPPYVLVGHSYGGVLVREFLRQHPDKVAGMVVVDSARTRTPMPPDWFTLLGDCSYYAIVGLDENHDVSEEEYKAIKDDEKRNLPTAQIEESYMEASTEVVNDALPEGCQALGDGRLSVIFANESVDFTKVYNYAVENTIGAEEARQRLASRFVYAEGKSRTHNIQYVTPEVIRDQVFWVLGLIE